MKRNLLPIVFLFISIASYAQITQTVRGRVVNADTKSPIKRTRVFILSDSMARGMATDSNGVFRFKNVATGRHTIKIQHKGHQTKVLNNVIVLSSKETVLNLELHPNPFSDKEETDVFTRNGEVSNEMAFLGAREFTVDETIRFAGSRGDPIRTALNFAGVQGLDDSRNDLVIRGNSPYSMAIQMEGVIIMNSNHFATPGSNGGPLSKISFKTLDNSDFYSGVMPAEFGNATSGIMDLKFKTGNNQKHEQQLYFGMLGADLFAEGPLSKKKGSSYIINYRYSTLPIFLNLGLDIGTTSVPFYQDLNFKFNFPRKNGSELSFWGITGNSISKITLSDDTELSTELYGDNDRDQHLESGLDVIGLTYNKPINSSTFLKTTLAYSLGYVYTQDDYIVSRDTLADGSFNPKGVETTPVLDYKYDNSKWTLYSALNHRIGKNKLIKVGFTTDLYNFSFIDSVRIISDPNWTDKNEWFTRWDASEKHALIQYFGQFKTRFNDKFQATLGLHGTYFTLGNGKSLIEPRLGLKYDYRPNRTLAFGAGLYSQTQAPYLHYYTSIELFDSLGKEFNKNLGLTKNWQASVNHTWILNPNVNFNIETYFQYLFNIPVEMDSSSFSLINTGTGFSRVYPNALKNTGTAYNYGLEVSLQRFFDKGYSYLINGTLYQSKYRGSDGVLRNTNFNGNYMFNALGTKEFDVGENSRFGIGTNITYAGGRRYGTFNEAESELEKDVVWLDEGYNENQFRDYFRLDFRLNYVINRAKTTHEFAVDLINILKTDNVLDYVWAPGLTPNSNFTLRHQIGFLPLFYYKVDF